MKPYPHQQNVGFEPLRKPDIAYEITLATGAKKLLLKGVSTGFSYSADGKTACGFRELMPVHDALGESDTDNSVQLVIVDLGSAKITDSISTGMEGEGGLMLMMTNLIEWERK